MLTLAQHVVSMWANIHSLHNNNNNNAANTRVWSGSEAGEFQQ